MHRKDWVRNSDAVGYAVYTAQFNGDAVTLAKVADSVGMSKNTTRRHLDLWIRAGFVRVIAVSYRPNSTVNRYEMPADAIERYVASGLLEIGKDSYSELLASRRRKLTGSLQSLIKQLELVL